MAIFDLLCDLREADDSGGSPARLKSLRQILRADPTTAQTAFGETKDTWLHTASGWFLHGAVKVFLDHGANPNARNREGLVPLGSIVGEFDENTAAVRTAKMLIRAGTDVNATTNDGESLIYLAWLTVFPQVYDLLRKAGAKWDLKVAALLGRVDVLAKLLAASAHPSKLVQSTPRLGEDAIRSAQYHTPESGHPAETLRLLLRHGLNPNGTGNHGFSYLVDAVTGAQDPDIVQALIDYGCDINAIHMASGLHQTPLDFALIYGHEQSAAVLRAAGAKTYRQLKRKR